MKAIFAVINTAQAVVKIRPEKTCRPVRACMFFFLFFFFFFFSRLSYLHNCSGKVHPGSKFLKCMIFIIFRSTDTSYSGEN